MRIPPMVPGTFSPVTAKGSGSMKCITGSFNTRLVVVTQVK